MDCCALNRDNSAVKATAKFSRLHNETTAPSFLIIISFENRTRPRRKVIFKIDFCAFEQDNSDKATAKFSGLHNVTTAQSSFKLIAWRIGRDHRIKKIKKWITAIKIETTAQSRLQQ